MHRNLKESEYDRVQIEENKIIKIHVSMQIFFKRLVSEVVIISKMFAKYFTIQNNLIARKLLNFCKNEGSKLGKFTVRVAICTHIIWKY